MSLVSVCISQYVTVSHPIHRESILCTRGMAAGGGAGKLLDRRGRVSGSIFCAVRPVPLIIATLKLQS